MKNWCILLLSVFIFSFCTVQNRKYRPGFTLHRLKNTTSTSIASSKVGNLQTTVLPKVSSNNLVLASAGNTMAFNNEGVIPSKAIKLPTLLPNTQTAGPDTCDVITFKNGTETKVKVLEITPAEIKYLLCNVPNGPMHIAKKEEVFIIAYSNGSRDVFKSSVVNNNGVPKKKYDPYSIIGISLCFLSILAPVGAIFGAVSLIRIQREPNKYKGKRFAIAALAFGSLLTLVYSAALLFN